MAPLRVQLSLCDWEKSLIRETKETFSKDLDQLSPQETPVSQEWIRFNWGWAAHVLLQLRSSCPEDDDEEIAIHEGNPDRTWEILRNRLSSRAQQGTPYETYSCYTRTSLLLDANSDLQLLVSQTYPPSIPQDCIQFAKEDNQDWEDIWNFSWFIKTNNPRLRGLQCSMDDLEELLQEYSRISAQQKARDPDPTTDADDHTDHSYIEGNSLCEYPAFEVYSMVRTVASYCRQSQVDLPKELADLRRESYSFLDMLEYIPISELRTEGDLAHHPKASWLPSKACPLEHLIFTEEEVFKYCVETGFEFLGFREQNAIIFLAEKLDRDQLCQSRKNLDVLWNDCSFTFDPETNQTYLLQTRPGIKFRELYKQFSLDAARKYFRSVTDEARLNKRKTFGSILHDMQLENSKLKAYEGLVELVPFHEIELSGEIDDTGHSGAIIFARWHVPQGARIQNPDSEVIPIALKRVWRSADPDQNLRKREFENSIVTFTDTSIASIRLDGLTVNPETNEIFLVFEKAKGVRDFLDELLVGSVKDWDLISELLRDAAESLGSIHSRGYLHRDIHMGNVLIHEAPCLNDPFDSTYSELVIIDLGQGKDMEDSAWASLNEYGNSEYMAPELFSRRPHSIKSDVFAIGYLMTEIFRIRCNKANDYEVPEALWDLVASCLQKEPDSRPKTDELVDKIQKLRDDFFMVPEERSVAVRGEVVMNGPSVNFEIVFAEWLRRHEGSDSDNGSDAGPRYESLMD